MAQTIYNAYNQCKKRLEAAGIEDFVFESKQIIKRVTGYTNAQILTKYTETLSEFKENNLEAIIKQRLMRYPLQYIFGKWNFYGHDFYCGPGVLIPRADTETLVDVCLDYLKNKPSAKVLDLCSGTGCIGITVGAEKPQTDISLLEKYDEAITYIEKNIKENKTDNVKAFKGDVLLGDLNDKKFDLIVSNPPYIKNGDMKTLQPELSFEPETALAGGDDGLDFYRAIVKNYKDSLTAGGMLAFEVGIDEATEVKKIMLDAGFCDVDVCLDAFEIERVVFGTVKGLL